MKSMGVCPLARKPMYIMLLITPLGNNMLSRSIRLLYWSLKIGIVTFKESLDLEEGIARAIQGKWSPCGLRSS